MLPDHASAPGHKLGVHFNSLSHSGEGGEGGGDVDFSGENMIDDGLKTHQAFQGLGAWQNDRPRGGGQGQQQQIDAQGLGFDAEDLFLP